MRRIEAGPSRPAPDLGRDAAALGWYRGCGRRPGADLRGRHPLHSIDPYTPHGTRKSLCIFSLAQRPSPRKPGPARPASSRRPISPRPIMRAAARPQPHQGQGLQRPRGPRPSPPFPFLPSPSPISLIFAFSPRIPSLAVRSDLGSLHDWAAPCLIYAASRAPDF